jgi:hypothetical protein
MNMCNLYTNTAGGSCNNLVALSGMLLEAKFLEQLTYSLTGYNENIEN